MPPRILAAAGLALAGGLATLAVSAGSPADAQAEFTASAEQLRINQRISQAAVRRSNEALTRLDALEAKPGAQGPQGPPGPQGAPGPAGGLTLTAFAPVERDGSTAGPPDAVPGPGLGNDVPPGQPMPSAPTPITAAPREGNPAPVGVAGVEVHQAPGGSSYTVRLTRPAWTCAVQATITDFEGGQVMASPPFGAAVVVATRAADGTPAPRSFNLLVFCPPS